MYSFSRKPIEISRQGSNKCFTFTRLHLGNFTIVQYHTTNELYIVMYHIPGDVSARSRPRVLPNSLVTFYRYKRFFGSYFSVMVGCSDSDSCIFGKTTSGFFDYSKCFRKNFFENVFEMLISFFSHFVEVAKHIFFSLHVVLVEGLVVEVFDILVNTCKMFFDSCSEV